MAASFPNHPLPAIRYPLMKWLAMQAFTEERGPETRDEIWFLEHPPVFTLGMNAAREHVLAPGDIPLVQIDRGGQVTYHGPGQLVVYPLLDVRQLVMALENGIIALLAAWNIAAVGRRDAPGIYVDGRKVASIGLRMRRGCSYHGLAFNVAMDLELFRRINPCGFRGLEVTDLRTLGVSLELRNVADLLAPHLLGSLGMHVDPRWT